MLSDSGLASLCPSEVYRECGDVHSPVKYWHYPPALHYGFDLFLLTGVIGAVYSPSVDCINRMTFSWTKKMFSL